MRIVENQKLVLGPPGTGKTTHVLNQVEGLMESGVAPDRIGFVSFTKKAITEAVDRSVTRFNIKKHQIPWFRTIHSMCFGALGISKADVMGREGYRELGEWLGYRFDGTWDESEGVPVGSEKGDTLLFLDNLARITQRPLRAIWEENYTECEWDELERFQDSYQDFKSSKFLMDFTDMLYNYVDMCDPAVVSHAFIDEGQDLSPMQWQVLKHAFQNAKQVTIAGDDDQSIYRWSGADVRSFLALEGDRHVLNKSYRLPSKVYQFASNLVSKIDNRFDKEFKPRDSEGELEFIPSMDMYELDPNSKTLFLVRNVYLASGVSKYLEREGVPYTFKHHRGIKVSHIHAARAVEKLRKGEQITGDEVKLMYDLMRVGYYLERGFKGKVATLQNHEVFDFATLRDKYGLKDLAPWHTMLQALPQDKLEYYRRVRANGFSLLQPPNVEISTIHAAKGGEADHVVLLSDMANRSYMEYEKHPDDERRVAYVGVTRAKERLTIVQPQSKLYFPYYNEGN